MSSAPLSVEDQHHLLRGGGGNFAGGRKELAMRLLSNCQEEEPSLDTTEEDGLSFQQVSHSK